MPDFERVVLNVQAFQPNRKPDKQKSFPSPCIQIADVEAKCFFFKSSRGNMLKGTVV